MQTFETRELIKICRDAKYKNGAMNWDFYIKEGLDFSVLKKGIFLFFNVLFPIECRLTAYNDSAELKVLSYLVL